MNWFDPVVLEGPTLRLTPLRLTDAAGWHAALGDTVEAEEVLRHMSYAPPPAPAAVRAVLAAALADPDRLPYVQRLAATDEIVGTTSFYEIEPARRSVAIGHTWLARRCWRTGINTQSKLLMLTRAFDGLGAERVVWHTDIANLRSQQAIERLGATREGVLRHHRVRRDGSWRDTVQYAMLAEEWPAVRTRLTRTRGGH